LEGGWVVLGGGGAQDMMIDSHTRFGRWREERFGRASMFDLAV